MFISVCHLHMWDMELIFVMVSAVTLIVGYFNWPINFSVISIDSATESFVHVTLTCTNYLVTLLTILMER